MTYSELIKEDNATRQYHYLISLLALYRQQPIKLYRFDNDKTSTMILIKQAENGTISSRKIVLDRAETVFFCAFIANDFPNLPFERLTAKDLFSGRDLTEVDDD